MLVRLGRSGLVVGPVPPFICYRTWIKHRVGWSGWFGWVGRRGVGVAGWNTSAAWFQNFRPAGLFPVGAGSACCWVLRRHLCVGVVLGAIFGLCCLSAPRVVVLVGWWRWLGLGVVVC